MTRRTGARGGGATSAVLWLMILLVFLPIALGHLAARRAHPFREPARQSEVRPD